MFKKIIIFLLCISPLLFVFSTGYPIQKPGLKHRSEFVQTRRCFKVGELNQFVNCYFTNPKLQGAPLIHTVLQNLHALYPGFEVVFVLSILFFFMSLILFI